MSNKQKHDGDFRGFIILSEAYYGSVCMRDDTVDEITLGMYCPDGGTSGEFCVQWEKLGDTFLPQLRAWEDSWSALHQFGDMLQWMASVDGKNVSPQEFAEALRDLGITDMTIRADRDKGADPAEIEYASWFQI